MRIALFDMFPEWPLARQTPDGALRWGATEFVINPSAGRFDGCVVFDGLLGETMIDCPGDRTIFIAGEPPSIKLYHTGFLAQFATVVTCHSDTPHPRKLHVQQGYPWHIGVARRDGGLVAALDYDAFRAAPPPEKEKLISVIVSDKAVTPGHAHRRAFAGELVGATSSQPAGACRLKPEAVFRDSLSKKLRQRLRRTVPRRFRRKAPAL